ncbi:MAG TPA: PKD domain-containing protein [Thermoplasmata archaeon]|nr:PKD domain-containing protein [Thermoplasmata archaeon]
MASGLALLAGCVGLAHPTGPVLAGSGGGHGVAGLAGSKRPAVANDGSAATPRMLTSSAAPPPLAASVRASQTAGYAPASISFEANVSGGTPPYTVLDWSFGDGATATGLDAVHQYAKAGDFLVQFELSDSAQQHGAASVWVNLSAAPITTVGGGGPPTVSPYVVWGGAALVGTGTGVLVLWIGLRWQARRSANDDAGEPPAPPPAPSDPGSMAPSPSAPSVAAASAGLAVRPTARQRRLTQEVLVHLYSLGRWGPHELAPAEATQAGIGSGIGSAQNALSNVLRRLEAAGFLASELTHVPGRSRRVKAYRLTPRGEALARSLRPPGPGAAVPPSESAPRPYA